MYFPLNMVMFHCHIGSLKPTDLWREGGWDEWFTTRCWYTCTNEALSSSPASWSYLPRHLFHICGFWVGRFFVSEFKQILRRIFFHLSLWGLVNNEILHPDRLLILKWFSPWYISKHSTFLQTFHGIRDLQHQQSLWPFGTRTTFMEGTSDARDRPKPDTGYSVLMGQHFPKIQLFNNVIRQRYRG